MKDLQKLVDDFNELRIKERTGLTFLEIAKCPNLEIVWSNILAFYLNPNNEHNLFDLILKSFFESAGKNVSINNFKKTRVSPEYPTKSGNKIDIVVFSDTFILGIENKVGAPLYNDLLDYSNTIESLAKPQNLAFYKVVLSKYRTAVSDGFINIIYSDLIRNIKKNIGEFTAYSDTRYLIFLFDFLKNIENSINSQSMADNLEVINFFHNNIDKVNRLMEYHNKFISDLVRKMDVIYRTVNQEAIRTRLTSLGKEAQFGGPGRFTWQGSQYMKFNVIVNDISLFYHVEISDYKLVSSYWFSDEKYQFLADKLEERGIVRTTYEYDDTEDSIALKIQEQLDSIVSVIDAETN